MSAHCAGRQFRYRKMEAKERRQCTEIKVHCLFFIFPKSSQIFHKIVSTPS
ncbi:hypothetical protein BRYFOR_06691 [Marvinbryantia formatexigens DSM 14469]|uniref:Uncharacterized protein n=1 Tax=Marvinbryantia formatexigens DSM 14469 TaxID=478749 RepID=C6LD33_9FIRM|nr:hypothetical protein BRYFOR_06691 [Marvinbryantia formatexigens DSM 14469]